MSNHYQGQGMQAVDVIDAFELNFRLANVVKYVLRCGKKGNDADAMHDLDKAIHYLQSEVAFRNGERGAATMVKR